MEPLAPPPQLSPPERHTLPCRRTMLRGPLSWPDPQAARQARRLPLRVTAGRMPSRCRSQSASDAPLQSGAGSQASGRCHTEGSENSIMRGWSMAPGQACAHANQGLLGERNIMLHIFQPAHSALRHSSPPTDAQSLWTSGNPA